MDGGVVRLRRCRLGLFDGVLLFGRQGRKPVDLDGVAVEDGEAHPIGREGEVLPGALDRQGLDMQELPAAVGLVDDHALAAEQLRYQRLCVANGRMSDDTAEREPAAGGGKDEGGGGVGLEEGLLPHLLSAHVEGSDDLHGIAAVTAEGNELTAADKQGGRATGGVEGRKLVGLAGVGVEVEGPMLTPLIDDGEIAVGGGGNSTRNTGADGAAGAEAYLVAGGGGDGEAKEVDLNGGGVWSLPGRRRGSGGSRGGAEAGWGGRGDGWALDGLKDEQVGVGREEDAADSAVGGDKRTLAEGLP